MSQSPKRQAYGFSLVEVMIAMTIGLMVLGSLISSFLLQQKTYDVEEQVAEMVQNARAAMDMMVREIRMAGYNPTGASFDGIPYHTSQLQISADLDGDGSTGNLNEAIIYTYDVENLRINRTAGAGAQPFAENIQSFIFDYLDAAGSATITSADIRQLQIAITARTAKPDPNYPGGYRTYVLRTLVTPENLLIVD